jgi:hypothetical protein
MAFSTVSGTVDGKERVRQSEILPDVCRTRPARYSFALLADGDLYAIELIRNDDEPLERYTRSCKEQV